MGFVYVQRILRTRHESVVIAAASQELGRPKLPQTRHHRAVLARDLAGMITPAESRKPARVRRVINLAIGVTLFCGVLLIVGVIAVGLLLSAPTRAIVGAAPADIPVESVSIASSSGATLRGW